MRSVFGVNKIWSLVVVVLSAGLCSVTSQDPDVESTQSTVTALAPIPPDNRIDPVLLWITLGILGGVILVLAVSLAWTVVRCLQGQRKLKDLESGSYKETRIVEQVNSAFQQDQLDGLHFTEDIKTVSPPIAAGPVYREKIQKQIVYSNNSAQPPEHNHRAEPSHDRRLRGPEYTVDPPQHVKNNAANDFYARIPPPQMHHQPDNRKSLPNEDSRPRRGRRDEYKYEMDVEDSKNGANMRRVTETSWETSGNHMPRTKTKQPRQPSSIPDLSRIDEIEVVERGRAGQERQERVRKWSYLAGPLPAVREYDSDGGDRRVGGSKREGDMEDQPGRVPRPKLREPRSPERRYREENWDVRRVSSSQQRALSPEDEREFGRQRARDAYGRPPG